MSESFSSYPMLTDDIYHAIGYVTEYPECTYTDNYEEFPLIIDGINGSASSFNGKIRDSRCAWYPDTRNLKVTKKCRLTSAYILFGLNGIASSNATLGVALRWISSKSDERGIIPIGALVRTDSTKEFQIEAVFDKGTLKGSLKLQTVLYLKDPGKATPAESHFAHQSGVILGILDQAELFIDGNGSIFPIVTIDEPGKSLWQVYYNESCDPLQDGFDSENVEIRLNRAHPYFDALRIDASISESPLFLEVISSALMVIVESAKESLGEDWNTTLSGDGYQSGSIAEAINYFVTRLQWDVSSPVNLAQSIKDFFEKNS